MRGLAEAWVNHPTDWPPHGGAARRGRPGLLLRAAHQPGVRPHPADVRAAHRELIAYNKCAGPVTVQGMTLERDDRGVPGVRRAARSR